MRHRRPQPRAPAHATEPRRIRPPDRTRRPPAHLTHLTATTSALRLRSPKNGSAAAHLPNPAVRVCEPYGLGGSLPGDLADGAFCQPALDRFQQDLATVLTVVHADRGVS